ncbi:unnamed protein product [Orchesella dallaii]|uniref:N-terminal kinase-like protein n=1 Tax=Orchesella dallaii TaxID=48710 RepID=A0ABP1QY89_9HEXA
MWSFFSRDPVKDFPYEIGEPISFDSERTFWKLHKGKKKANGEEVTIFILDTKNSSPSEIEAAKAAVKRLKMLRHPSVLTFLDSVESDKAVYLATESVEPLGKYLERKENTQGDLSVAWGLFQVTRALSFLINDGNLRHNNVHIGSVFVNAAGEWKLASVEYVSGSDSSQVIGKVPSCLSQLDPPEVKTGSQGATKWSNDSWGLGILIWEVFNEPLHNIALLKNADKIPKTLVNVFKELTNQNPSSRPNPADVIARSRRPGGFYKNDLVDSLLFLEEIQIKEQTEKTRFFTGLPTVLDKFPEELCRHKILPQLINAFEFGNAGSSVLAPLFKLGKLLDEPEYQAKIVPCVVKLFTSTDRATRVRLLQQLEHFVDHLQPNTVNDKIFPNIVTGFMDTNPTVREQTVRAMLFLSPKLNYNNLNVELLKYFARLQIKDDQGGIRTNTTICLGKISCFLNPQTRRKVLIPAFTRVFQDVFPQAKIAGILALAATQQYYLLSEVASKILPALSTLTCDPDKTVRDNAFKTIKGFLGKLEKVSEDPSLKEKFEADVDAAASSAADAASSWAGWAVSALTSKFQRSQSSNAGLALIGQGGNPVRSKGRFPMGNQSSSSTSTTTSSIPSTPSVDKDVLQPTAEGQESATDYEDDWDNEDWGAIDGNGSSQSNVPSSNKASEFSSVNTGAANPSSRSTNTVSDGWDTWAIEETEEKDGWDGDFDVEPKNGISNSSDDFISNKSNANESEFLSSVLNTNKGPTSNQTSSEWGSTDSDGGSLAGRTTDPEKLEEMRKRREERKLHRQNELETKRSTRKGPMKLGSKKI